MTQVTLQADNPGYRVAVTEQKHLEPLGDPDGDDAGSDFASEHNNTAVDEDITDGSDTGEPESPDGWDGMDSEGAP